MQARKTPSSVVKIATSALLSIQRANGWSLITEVKFETESFSGQGTTARSRSPAVGVGGRSAMARLCLPEKAMLNTQSTG